MIIFSIIITLFAIACGSPLGFQSRIIGGDDVKIEDYPYQISLQYNKRHRCGGSIIQPNIILTAAHCVEGIDQNNLTIRAGSVSKYKKGVVVDVLKAITHESYKTGILHDHDIAILVLAQALNFSDTIQPIELTTQEATDGNDAVVSGWGNHQEGIAAPSTKLRAVHIRVISYKRCIEYYKASNITERMMCAGVLEGGKGSCQGDSGGPLVVNGKQVGVVSWAYGCSRPNRPTVFANVANLLGWINSKVQNVN